MSTTNQKKFNPLAFPWEQGIAPTFVNEEGFEWYIEDSFTNYCNSKKLPHLRVYIVRKEGYPLNRVLVDHSIQKDIYENPRMEDMACHIDFIHLTEVEYK